MVRGYVTGLTRWSEDAGLLVWRVSSLGTTKWAFAGPNAHRWEAIGVATDPSADGGVVVVGGMGMKLGTSTDNIVTNTGDTELSFGADELRHKAAYGPAFVWRINTEGTTLWATISQGKHSPTSGSRLPRILALPDYLSDVAVDGSGGEYARQTRSSEGADFLLIWK